MPKYDWDALAKKLREDQSIRPTTLVAEMPAHPPIRLMTGVCESIPPLPLRSIRFVKRNKGQESK